MTKEELRAKYARIPTDFSEIEMLKDQLLDSGLLEAAQVDPTQAGKVFGILEDGSIGLVEGGGPAPAPVEKGSIIKLGNDDYRVLSVNVDLTDCEVVHLGPTTVGAFSNASPGQDPSAAVTFIVDGVEKTGIKYEGSLIDQACEAFYNALPADIKAAIIEQEVVQDMYDVGKGDSGGDFYFDNTAEGGAIYRIKKVNDVPVTVGTRHAYQLSCGAIKKYFGGTSARGVDVGKVFQLQSWFNDAFSSNTGGACCLGCDASIGIYVYSYYYAHFFCVCPAFHIDLTKVSL